MKLTHWFSAVSIVKCQVLIVTMPSYAYIYDAELAHPRHRQELNRLETRLTDIGLHGNIHRLTALKSIEELVEEECAQETKTIVAVGSDATFHDLISVEAARGIVVGYIPFSSLANQSILAPMLNMHNQEEAYIALSQRYIVTLPMNNLNNKQFTFEATCELPSTTLIHIDDNYTILPITKHQRLHITQQPLLDNTTPLLKILLVAGRSEKDETVVYTKKAVVESPTPLLFYLDGSVAYKAALAQFNATTASIRCIAGRSRITQTPSSSTITRLANNR